MAQWREVDRGFGHRMFGHGVQQVADHRQAAAALVVEVHQRPRRLLGVRGLQHGVAGSGVVGVFLAGLQVNGTQLPALQRVGQAFCKAFFLLRLVHREPVLEEQHAVVDEHLLEHRRLLQEGVGLGFTAVAHDPFNAGTVVPAAVQQHDFAGRRQMRHITLKVPLRALSVGGLGQRHHAALARVQRFCNGRNDAAFAGRVAPFHYHHQAPAGVLQPARHVVQCQLQRRQFFQVFGLAELARLAAGWLVGFVALLAHGMCLPQRPACQAGPLVTQLRLPKRPASQPLNTVHIRARALSSLTCAGGAGAVGG